MTATNLLTLMVVCWTISICMGFSFPSLQTTQRQSQSQRLNLIRPKYSLSHARVGKTGLFSANATTVADPTTSSSESSSSKPLSKNQEALSNRKFPRTWVPLASVFELDPNRPTPLEFLDQKFVCYKQTTDESIDDDWIVMDDVCPHRLVPLSEGRINRCGDEAAGNATTTVQCSYHGWEFDGSKNGACVNIPQATDDIAAQAKASSRSAATTYSVRVHKNVLFFWPWADKDPLSLLEVYPKGHPEGIMESIAVMPPEALENDDDGDSNTIAVSAPNTYTRDLPYGWDTLLENLIDPAHIPFAHHNLQGTRDDAIPIQMTVPESLGEFSKTGTSGEAGFMFEWQDRTMKKHRAGTAEFKAPFGIAYDGKFYDDKDEVDALWGTHVDKKKQQLAGVKLPKDDTEKRPFTLGVLCIPTKPGWSRAIIITGGKSKQIQAKADKLTQQLVSSPESSTALDTSDTESTKPKKKKQKKSLLAKIFGIVPVWVIHLLSNKFLDSDLAFLHHQEQERLRYDGATGNSGSSSYYYMPAPADRCIAKLRQWIPKHTDYMGTKDGHKYSLPPIIVNRSQLFDRYLQHTIHCKHCQEGLKFLRTKAKKIAWSALFTSVVASHFLGKRLLGLAAKLMAVACLGVIRFTTSLEKAFLVGDFKHYENE